MSFRSEIDEGRKNQETLLKKRQDKVSNIRLKQINIAHIKKL